MNIAARHRIADPMQFEGAFGLMLRGCGSRASRAGRSVAVIRGGFAQRAIELVGWLRVMLHNDLVGGTLHQRLGNEVPECRDEPVALAFDFGDLVVECHRYRELYMRFFQTTRST